MESFELLSEIIVSDNEVDITAFESLKTIDGLFIEENLEKREDTFFVDDDLRQLESLLNDFNLLQLLPILQAANVTYRCLQYIQKEDLIEAIPHLGLRVEFREKLFMWRKKEFGIDDDTISNPNKVVDWLTKDYSNIPSPSYLNVLCFPITLKNVCPHFQSYEIIHQIDEIYTFNIEYFDTYPIHSYTINNGKTYIRPKMLI